jgi:IS1 family transposase
VGTEPTQKIESNHSHLRTWSKRRVHRTLCRSNTQHMHALVLELCINRYALGRLI